MATRIDEQWVDGALPEAVKAAVGDPPFQHRQRTVRCGSLLDLAKGIADPAHVESCDYCKKMLAMRPGGAAGKVRDWVAGLLAPRSGRGLGVLFPALAPQFKTDPVRAGLVVVPLGEGVELRPLEGQARLAELAFPPVPQGEEAAELVRLVVETGSEATWERLVVLRPRGSAERVACCCLETAAEGRDISVSWEVVEPAGLRAEDLPALEAGMVAALQLERDLAGESTRAAGAWRSWAARAAETAPSAVAEWLRPVAEGWLPENPEEGRGR